MWFGVEGHPIRFWNWADANTHPMHFASVKCDAPNVLKEEQGDRTLNPVANILFNFTSSMFILYRNAYFCEPLNTRTEDPSRLGKSRPIKSNRKRRGVHFNCVPQAERTLEPDPSETDCVKYTLVRVPEAAQRGKLFFREVFAVMRKDEGSIVNLHRRFRGSGVVCVLKELGQDVPWTLNLFEKLMPGSSELRILLELIPSPSSIGAGMIVIRRWFSHLGASALSISSAKS
jgi:hypothetical protein